MDARFDAYAVSARAGPHVTIQAGVVHGGRHWTTATRNSVKAACLKRQGRASAAVGADSRWRVIAGAARALDLAHLSTLTADPCAATLAGTAMLRLGLGRLDQLFGYAEAGRAVPVSFLPNGRVLLVIRIHEELIVDGDEVVGATGQWADRPSVVAPGHWRPPPWRVDRVLAGVPDDTSMLARHPGHGWLGVQTGLGAIALPARWEPALGRIRVGRGALAAIGAELYGPVCLTLHDSASRRPDEKCGVMLRGTGGVVDVDDTAASVAIDVGQVTYWRGFATTTVGLTTRRGRSRRQPARR